MKKLLKLIFVPILISCSSPSSSGEKKEAVKSNKDFVEGKDYTVLQRVRVEDKHGFAQPVVAYSILLPKGWSTQGGITWATRALCMNEAVSNRLTAWSADRAFQLDFFPIRTWEWVDDPILLQSKQQNLAMGYIQCDVMQPFNADAYVQNIFANEIGNPQIVNISINQQLNAALEDQARRNSSSMQAAGINSIAYRPSAVTARLKFRDGSSGIALCSVNQTIYLMPNYMNGGTISSYQCSADQKVVLKYPAGKDIEAEKLLSMVMSSIRINPQWQNAVAQVFSNIARGQQIENAKRQAIWKKTQDEIADIQKQTWEYQQESRDRISEETGRMLRGVEQWTDPSTGDKTDLTLGYNEAWSKGDGTYILSNDPLFDPNIVLQEDWKRMEKKD